MVRYRGVCDVYGKYYVWDADTGIGEFDWDYENPEQIMCNVAELNPENVQELFVDKQYLYTKTIKIETDVPLLLENRIGNIQMKTRVYEDLIFNIDNVQPRLDWSGRTVGYRAICRSTLI